MNQVFVSGNCVKDAELRATGAGLSVLNIRLAVNNRRKKGDEWVDEPVFIDVVTFGSQAENVHPAAKKGEKLYVLGRLTQSQWEKDGVKHTRTDILADRIETPNYKRPESGQARSEAPPAAPVTDDSDVPF